MTSMTSIWKTIFSTSPYTNEAEQIRAQFLYGVLSLVFVTIVAITYLLPTSNTNTLPIIALIQDGQLLQQIFSLDTANTLLLICIICAGMVRYGYLNQASWLLLVGTIGTLTINNFDSGFNQAILAVALSLAIVLGGLLLGQRGVLIIGSLTLAAFLLVTTNRIIAEGAVVPELSAFGGYTVLLASTYFFLRIVRVSRAEGEHVASQERLKLADLTTQITRQASERATMQTALRRTLQLILENYPQFYHAQVFLLDEERIEAELVASTGTIGQALMQQKHRLAVGSLSVIGQTTFKAAPVIAYAAEENSIHRENRLLPETQLEAAFPLQVGQEVIGALDLQSREALALNNNDISTLQSLADSLSLVIDSIQQYEAAQARVAENQRLAEQARGALREVERLNKRLIGRAWFEYLSGRDDNLGLNVDLTTMQIEGDQTWTATLSDAAQSGSVVQENKTIAIPLRVRGHVIGAMEFELGPGYDFSPGDFELVQEVTERFGLAVENTRLVEESQRIAQRESLINEISSRLQSTNNVEATLTEAARSLSETLQAGRVAIRLGSVTPLSANGQQHQKNGRSDSS